MCQPPPDLVVRVKEAPKDEKREIEQAGDVCSNCEGHYQTCMKVRTHPPLRPTLPYRQNANICASPPTTSTQRESASDTNATAIVS
jgi:hypothetical protein